MIKNVLFDCSDTLLHFEARKELAKRLGGDMERATHIHLTTYRCATFRRYGVGTISYEEAKPQALALLDECDRQAGEEFLDTRMLYYREIEGISELLKKLKNKGYKLYIVSDFPDHFEYIWKKFDIFRLFDGRAVSFEEHAGKTNGMLFEAVIKKYDLDPTECVFVDDTADNVIMSETYGMKGIRFTDTKALISELEKLEIL